MDNKNFIIAIALSLAVLIGWQYFFIEPRQQAEQKSVAEQHATHAALAPSASSVPPPAGTAATVHVVAGTPPVAVPGHPALPAASRPHRARARHAQQSPEPMPEGLQ